MWPDGWPWYSEYNGYEHDFAMRPNYLSSCTSWTTLPNGYDDCPTASAEGGEFWAFAFGSYYGRDIVPNNWYFGVWNFSNDGPDPSTDFFLNGQEVWHQFCPWDSPWCMNGIQSWRLLRPVELGAILLEFVVAYLKSFSSGCCAAKEG